MQGLLLQKKRHYLLIKHFSVRTILSWDKVINTQKIMSLDSQEESDNEFIMREEATRLANSLLDNEAGMKHTSLNVIKDLLFMSVPQPQHKLDQARPRVSITPKTRHEISRSQSVMARMRSTSPPRKRVKTTGGHKIAESIQGMVEEL